MNPTWKDTLGAAYAIFDNAIVTGFGDATAELLAARDETVICPLGHLSLIRVSGEDAKTFLHSQFTSDINNLEKDVVQHSSWCNAKGRMVASFIVWREDADYLLALAADLVEAIAKRLQMYVLRAKVKITIESEMVLLGLSGARAKALLATAGLPTPPAMKSAPLSSGSLFCLNGNDEKIADYSERFIVAVSATNAPELWHRLTDEARPVGVPAWHWLDIRAAIPVISATTREQFVPQMANFERIGGVSFHKGCYPGQEIVARTQYLGKVKRHLYRVTANVAMATGTELFSPATEEQSCGRIICGTKSPTGGFEALAVLMEAAAETSVSLGERGGPLLKAVPVTN